MQKEKHSFERFQGIDKTCVNGVSAAAGRPLFAPDVPLNSALLGLSQASSTTRLLSVPISGTEMSTTSPALSQRGGSNRAPAPTGVPATMMSPGFSVVKIVM